VALTLGYGITDEIHQMFVPGRIASVADILADITGGMLGAWIYLKTRKS
jgi:VanZ family protein